MFDLLMLTLILIAIAAMLGLGQNLKKANDENAANKAKIDMCRINLTNMSRYMIQNSEAYDKYLFDNVEYLLDEKIIGRK